MAGTTLVANNSDTVAAGFHFLGNGIIGVSALSGPTLD